MNNKKCNCPHHWAGTVAGVLSWIAAILFFWTEIGATLVLGYDSAFYFQSFVIVALVGMGLMKGGGCKCCCGDMHCRECTVSSSPM